MAAASSSGKHSILLAVLRVLQFLASITMLILFSIRLARLKHRNGRVTSAVGAVEGILCAAVAYTFFAMVLQAIKRTGSKIFSILFLLMDLAFVCGWIVVSVLTSPLHYSAAYSCIGDGAADGTFINEHTDRFDYCSLPWGPFMLGILSTLSFTATAILHGTGARGNSSGGFRESKKTRGAIDGPAEGTTVA